MIVLIRRQGGGKDAGYDVAEGNLIDVVVCWRDGAGRRLRGGSTGRR